MHVPIPPPAVIRLHPNDNVIIARHQLIGGSRVDSEQLFIRGLIPAGHKVASRAIASGEIIHRYGEPIGVATCAIRPGEHVHLHNLSMSDADKSYDYCSNVRSNAPARSEKTFHGIRRPDGRVASRNFVGIIASVNCAATVAHAIADHFRRDLRPESLAPFPNVDGVIALTHGGGCGIDAAGEGLGVLRRTLEGYAQHPNFGAVLLVGLGCETNQIDSLAPEALATIPQLHRFSIQELGGTRASIARGIEIITGLLPAANDCCRGPVSVSHLTVGLQCGGSDGYSGITANPALGIAVDQLVQHGGTAILSETPEIYGAEQLLVRRAVSRAVGEKLLARIDWWRHYCAKHGAALSDNPSAGNKAGGLTTLAEKALGGVAKAGSSDLVEVYEYAERVLAKGLVFMDTPGFDPTSTTGQVAGGANLICFTTGRGAVYGSQPSPTLKLASNTPLWMRQRDDLDLNCGEIVDGSASIEQVGGRIFDRMLACASGERTASEQHGYGQHEFVPWQISVVT